MAETQNQTAGSVAAQARQQEKEQTERQAAATGAQAVADAVTKVAQAATDAARSQSGGAFPPGDFIVVGAPGGRFELRSKAGQIFSSSGSVLVGGKAQHIDEWGADYIRGKFDAGLQSGEVVVQIDAQTRRTGYLKVA